MSTTAATVERWHGEAAVVLRVGEWQAVYLPELGMLGASLRHGDDELLARPGGIAAYRHGHTTALPLLHPWANRLSSRRYRAAGTVVDLRDASVHTDANGLPIHGTMTARSGWRVVHLGASTRVARLTASFDFGGSPDLLTTFPFPHVLTIDATLTASGLRVRTELRPSGRRRVPVSFGYHPYLRLPGVPVRDWAVELPPVAHLALDARGIPTGRAAALDAHTAALSARDYDDLYALGPTRHFTLHGAGASSSSPRVSVTFDDGYAYAQVYAPRGATFCCIEPMTAPTNALVTGDATVVRPGEQFSATFSIALR